MPVVEGQKAAAEILGITDRRLRDWLTMDGCPQPTGPNKDQYDTDALKTWGAGRFDKRGAEDDEDVQQRRIGRQLENEDMQVRVAERKFNLAIKHGQYHPTSLTMELLAIVFAEWGQAHAQQQRTGDVSAAKITEEHLQRAERRIRQKLEQEKRNNG